MLCFSAIVPHPPVLIPAVGGQDLQSYEKTVNALLKLSLVFAAKAPEVVILLSPHTIILHDRVAIAASENLSGTLADFEAPDVTLALPGDSTFARQIVKHTTDAKIPSELYTAADPKRGLEYSSLVPLYYLSRACPEFSLVVCSISDFSLARHVRFGEGLLSACQEDPRRIAVIASADLSHTLTAQSPVGYRPASTASDQRILAAIQKGDWQYFQTLESDAMQEEGQVDYPVLAMLSGVMRSSRQIMQMLSYEAPSGIGHLVAYI